MSAPEPEFPIVAEEALEEPKRGPGRPKKETPSLYPVNDHPFEEVETVDFSSLLEEEDKIFLALKWGKFYTAEEWLALEKLYLEMINSFEISDAARDTTLKMICKTVLKMNQAVDAGDIETYSSSSSRIISSSRIKSPSQARSSSSGPPNKLSQQDWHVPV